MRASKTTSSAQDKQAIKEILAEYMATHSKKNEFVGRNGVFQLPTHLEVAAVQEKSQRETTDTTKRWYYTYNTVNSLTCTNQASSASGVVTDTCLVDVKKNDSSVFITCDMEKKMVYVAAYNNTICSESIRNYEVFNATFGCDSEYTVESGNQAYFRGCSNDTSSYSFPEGPTYATYAFFDDAACTNSLSYTGLMNGACLAASTTKSVRITYPGVIYYPASVTCSGLGITYAGFFDQTCVVNDDEIIAQFDGDVVNNDDLLSLHFGYRQAGLFVAGETQAPTLSPTIAPPQGWVYSYVTPGDSCSDSAPFARGYATGVCLPASSTQAVMYTCNNGNIGKTVYSSLDCDTNSVVTSNTFPTGCRTEFDADFNTNVGIYHGCSSGAMSAKLPNDLTFANYEYYDDDTCSTLLHYNAIENNRCISLGGKSLFVEYPNQRVFPDSENCVGKNSTHLAYSQTCTGGYFATYGPGAIPEAISVDDGVVPSFTYKFSALVTGPSPSSSSSSNSLSTGAIVGIAVGGAVLAIAIVAFLYFFIIGKAVSLGGSTRKNPMASRDEEN